MKSVFFALIAASLLAGGCGRVDCINAQNGFYVGFSGYDTDRGVQVFVSQLPAYGSQTPIRTDTFEIDSNWVYRMIPDSAGKLAHERKEIGLYQGYTWQISVPSTGKVDRISGLEYTDDSRKKQLMEGGGWGDQCINVCTGYYLNGKHMSTGFTGAVSYGGNTVVYVTLTKN